MKDHVPPFLGCHLYSLPHVFFHDSILKSLTHYLLLSRIKIALAFNLERISKKKRWFLLIQDIVVFTEFVSDAIPTQRIEISDNYPVIA